MIKMSKQLIIFEVQREEVEEQDTKGFTRIIQSLSLKGKEAKSSLAVAFGGYDEDKRELFEIEEVRNYMTKVFKKVPHMFYFINQEPYQSQQLLLTCLADIDIFFQGEKLSAVEVTERYQDFEEIPEYRVRIHMGNRLWNTLKAETRKYARSIQDSKGAEEIIHQMEELYIKEEDR